MDITIKRKDFLASGILGQMFDLSGNSIAYTLEHAYEQPDHSYAPKIPPGIYTCRRGQHLLHSMKVPFEAFEVLDVPEHSKVLIHMGNYNADSDGCILIGKEQIIGMVTHSRETFVKFMKLQDGVNEFSLIIS